MINKLIIFITVLIFITTSAIPYWTGIEAERQFALFNQSIYPLINLKLLNSHYQRGWFSSQAQSTFETQDSSDPVPQDQRFIFVHEIDHGFLPIQSTSIDTTLHTVPNFVSDPKAFTEDIGILNIHTVLKANGNGMSTFTIPAQVFNLAEAPIQLSWPQLHGSLYFRYDFATLQAELIIPEIQIKRESQHIIISDLILKANLHQDIAELMLGKVQLSSSQVKWQGHPQFSGQLDHIVLSADTQAVDKTYLKMILQTQLKTAQVNETVYGPGQCHLELNHLHAPTLSQIKKRLTDSRHQGLSPEQMNVVMLGVLMQYGPTLLNQAPELAIHSLKLQTVNGNVHGQMALKLNQFKIEYLLNPWALGEAIHADLALSIPQSLVQQLTQNGNTSYPEGLDSVFNTLLEQGILVTSAPQEYVTQIQLRKGILKVNDHPLPLRVFW